jgi:hypothetical protein
VRKLSEGVHPIEVSLRAERTAKALEQCLAKGYVHIKFTDTIGGSELGVRLNTDSSDFSAADFRRGTGSVKIVGELTLDYIRVRCIAQVELASLQGQGKLEVVSAPATA